MNPKEKATELAFLRYFYQNADFGPADCDVRGGLKEIFVKRTGKDLPEGYDDREDE